MAGPGLVGNRTCQVKVTDLLHRMGCEPDERTYLCLLDGAADPSGGWARPRADLETTAVATRLAQLLERNPRSAATLTSWLRRCEDRNLGYRLNPGAQATTAGALWGGLSLGQPCSCHLDTRPRWQPVSAYCSAPTEASARDTGRSLHCRKPGEALPPRSCSTNLTTTSRRTTMTSYTRLFSEFGIKDVPLVGGKSASLGEMYRTLSGRGVRVPDGFSIAA